MAQRSYVQRCKSAEDDVRTIAANAREAVSKLATIPLLLDAAMAVILKHNLLGDLAEEHSKRQEQSRTPGE